MEYKLLTFFSALIALFFTLNFLLNFFSNLSFSKKIVGQETNICSEGDEWIYEVG